MRIAVLILMLLFAQPMPRPGEMPSAGSLTDPETGESHGWVVYPIKDQAIVQHLPPRGSDRAGKPGLGDGSIRVAATLAQVPVAMGAWGDRVYMVFGPTSAGPKLGLRRPVLMLDAQRRSIDGDWVGEPEGERLPTAPGLPGAGKLMGFAATAAGPWALVSEDSRVRLLRLSRDAWVEVPLPGRELGSSLRLMTIREGLALVERGAASGVWVLPIKQHKAGREPEAGDWEWRPLKFEDRETGDAVGEGQVLWLRDQWLIVTRGKDGVAVRRVTDSGSSILATVRGVERDFAAIPLDQTGRLEIVWRQGETLAPKKATVERVMIAEVSAQTGQVLYEGEAQPRRPFSAVELRLLAAFLVVVMLAIVVFVLRPDSAALPASLPAGVTLAEPGRRVFAAMLDTALAVIVASQVTGVRPSALLNVQVLMTQPDAMTLYLAAIGVGALLGALTEWVFGTTFGKAMCGIDVVRPVFGRTSGGEVTLELRRVSLWRSIVRNVAKWVLPPVAMSGLSTPDRRHRGDLAAGTIVVERTGRTRKG